MAEPQRPGEPLEDLGAPSAGTRFLSGVHLAFGGLAFAFGRRELRLLSLLTVLLNVAIYLALVVVGLIYLDDAVRWLGPDPEKWDGFMRTFMVLVQGLLQVVLVLVWVLFSVFLALSAASVLAGPLFDMLSERTEAMLVGRSLAPPFTLTGTVAGALREAFVQVLLFTVYLPVVLLILLVGLLPVIGQVAAPALTWAWSSMWVTLTFVAPAAARHGLGVGARLRMLFSSKALSMGFGAVASVVPFLLIPLFAPGLVVGGTRLFLSLAAYERVESKLSAADKAGLQKVPTMLPR